MRWHHAAQRALLRRLPWLAGLALLGATLPAWHDWAPTATGAWLADLTVHWQWAYAVVGGVAAALWAALTRGRARRWAAVTGVAGAALLLVNLTLFVLPALPSHAAAVTGDATRIKLASFNVHVSNRAHEAIVAWVDAERPDVLALLEVTPEMQPLLTALAARYPHAAVRSGSDPFGLAVFSRHAWTGQRFVDDAHATPRFVAHIQGPDGPWVLNVIHPMPPIAPGYRAERDALFDGFTHAPAGMQAQVLMGDFNSTPWSAGLRRLGHVGWARATPLQPTFKLLRSLPIDHILATRAHWRVAAAGVGPWLGSDHRPVWAVLHAVRASP